VRFLRNVLGDPVRAAEIEDEALEDYAGRRKFQIQNPNTRKEKRAMATLKQQLAERDELIDQVESVLQEAYEVTATREQLAEAIGTALEIISPDDEDDEGEGDDEDDGGDEA
jgi:hypothetical protein